MFAGGAGEVEAAAKRHAGLQGKALRLISVLSVCWLAMIAGWAGLAAGVLAIMIGLAIFNLAQRSLRRQLKTAAGLDAFEATSRFLTMQLLASFRIAVCCVFHLLTFSRASTLEVLQRLFLGLAGLVHLALSKRLLPIPFCPR